MARRGGNAPKVLHVVLTFVPVPESLNGPYMLLPRTTIPVVKETKRYCEYSMACSHVRLVTVSCVYMYLILNALQLLVHATYAHSSTKLTDINRSHGLNPRANFGFPYEGNLQVCLGIGQPTQQITNITASLKTNCLSIVIFLYACRHFLIHAPLKIYDERPVAERTVWICMYGLGTFSG